MELSEAIAGRKVLEGSLQHHVLRPRTGPDYFPRFRSVIPHRGDQRRQQAVTQAFGYELERGGTNGPRSVTTVSTNSGTARPGSTTVNVRFDR